MLTQKEIKDSLVVMRGQEDNTYSLYDYFQLLPQQEYESQSQREEHQLPNHENRSRAEASSNSINENHREIIVDWYYNVIDYFMCHRETVSIAISYLDRFLASNCARAIKVINCREEYRLAALTTLFMAIKINERVAIDMKLFTDLGKGLVTQTELEIMEIDILFGLNWHVNGPTAQSFAVHLLSLMQQPMKQIYFSNNSACSGAGTDISPNTTTSTTIIDTTAVDLDNILKLAIHQIELSVGDSELMTQNPSIIATASILNSTFLMKDQMNQFFSSSLLQLTSSLGISYEKVLATKEHLLQLKKNAKIQMRPFMTTIIKVKMTEQSQYQHSQHEQQQHEHQQPQQQQQQQQQKQQQQQQQSPRSTAASISDGSMCAISGTDLSSSIDLGDNPNPDIQTFSEAVSPPCMQRLSSTSNTEFLEDTNTFFGQNNNNEYKTSTDKQAPYTKAQSLRNVSSIKPSSFNTENMKGGNVLTELKECEYLIQDLELQSPVSSQKLHKPQCVASPPQSMMRKPLYHFHDYNNTLKVVFIGPPNSGKSSIVSALTLKERKNRIKTKSVDINIQTWSPVPTDGDRRVKYNLWDIPGGKLDAGAHHSTQTLFFSSNSLYVLVWDMSANNPDLDDLTLSNDSLGSDYDSDDYEDELMNAKRDQIIKRDINTHVMYWIDLLSTSGLSDYAILPVATFKDKLNNEDIEHRCNLLIQHLSETKLDSKNNSNVPQLIFDSKGSIPKLSTETQNGIADLEAFLQGVVNNKGSKQPLFQPHLESKLCFVIFSVQNIINEFKERGMKVVHFEEVVVKLTENWPIVEKVTKSLISDALKYLSNIGNILFFDFSKGTHICSYNLGNYVVLSPSWLSTALSLAFYWGPESSLDEIRKTLKSVESQDDTWKLRRFLPIFSEEESIQLLSGPNFIQKEGGESSELYYFLQKVCEYGGILVPFSIATKSKRKQHFYLIPLFAHNVAPDFWSYKVKDEWKTTLCHIFSSSDYIPTNFIDKVVIEIFTKMFELSVQNPSTSLKIEQVLYWKTAIYMKVSQVFEDENRQRKCHLSEIFVQIINSDSPNYVGINNSRKLIASAKGLEGGEGEKIWKLGFDSVLDSIENVANIHMQAALKREIACPHCLVGAKRTKVIVWESDDIKYGNEHIRCINGHQICPQLLLGPTNDGVSLINGGNSVLSDNGTYSVYKNASYQKVEDMLPAVVIVAFWDKRKERILKVGSGFIADKKWGLIITAGHNLFNYGKEKEYGSIDEPFFGLSEATALIGINQQESDSAVFTYCADIIASDVYNIDGCVLRIKSKLARPVDIDNSHLPPRSEIPLSTRSDIKKQGLQHLLMTTEYHREEQIRVLGFRQTDEDCIVSGGHINRTACFSRGYLCRPLKIIHHKADKKFVPRSEIIVSCSVGSGNSGGPFVNESGEVIGILSRTDPNDIHRCYVAVASELKVLLEIAKQKCKNSQHPLLPYDKYTQY